MPKSKIIIFCFIFITFFSKIFAQDELLENRIVQTKKDTKIYNIQSLEGRIVKVKVLPDYVHNILCIIYLTDTAKVFDYWDVTPETSHLSKQFLKINYEVQGGSNFGLGNSLIICVSNNKLYEALHVLRYTDCETGFLTKTYNVKFSLVYRKKDYLLPAIIRDKSLSTDAPETDYHYTNITTLHFDRKLKVFYSIKYNLYDTLKVCYPNLTYTRIIEGNFPKVILEDQEYVFIGGQWFGLDKGGLIKY